MSVTGTSNLKPASSAGNTRRCFQRFVRLILHKRWRLSRKAADSLASAALNGQQGMRCFFVFAETEIAGMSIFAPESDVGFDGKGWLCALWVEPKHRGHGLAQVLVAAVMKYAREQKYTRLYLDTTDAVQYHLNHGWRIVTKDGMYLGEKTVIMEHDL